MIQLDHRERFQMELWILLLQSRKQISEITEREFGVQAAGDVQFSGTFRHGLSGDAQRIVDVVSVGVGLARRAKETTELAIDITDIRRIEMSIDVEVRRPAMLLSPHGVGKFAERVEIVGAEEGHAVFEREALAAIYFPAKLVKLGVV